MTPRRHAQAAAIVRDRIAAGTLDKALDASEALELHDAYRAASMAAPVRH